MSRACADHFAGSRVYYLDAAGQVCVLTPSVVLPDDTAVLAVPYTPTPGPAPTPEQVRDASLPGSWGFTVTPTSTRPGESWDVPGPTIALTGTSDTPAHPARGYLRFGPDKLVGVLRERLPDAGKADRLRKRLHRAHKTAVELREPLRVTATSIEAFHLLPEVDTRVVIRSLGLEPMEMLNSFVSRHAPKLNDAYDEMFGLHHASHLDPASQPAVSRIMSEMRHSSHLLTGLSIAVDAAQPMFDAMVSAISGRILDGPTTFAELTQQPDVTVSRPYMLRHDDGHQPVGLWRSYEAAMNIMAAFMDHDLDADLDDWDLARAFVDIDGRDWAKGVDFEHGAAWWAVPVDGLVATEDGRVAVHIDNARGFTTRNAAAAWLTSQSSGSSTDPDTPPHDLNLGHTFTVDPGLVGEPNSQGLVLVATPLFPVIGEYKEPNGDELEHAVATISDGLRRVGVAVDPDNVTTCLSNVRRMRALSAADSGVSGRCQLALARIDYFAPKSDEVANIIGLYEMELSLREATGPNADLTYRLYADLVDDFEGTAESLLSAVRGALTPPASRAPTSQ